MHGIALWDRLFDGKIPLVQVSLDRPDELRRARFTLTMEDVAHPDEEGHELHKTLIYDPRDPLELTYSLHVRNILFWPWVACEGRKDWYEGDESTEPAKLHIEWIKIRVEVG